MSVLASHPLSANYAPSRKYCRRDILDAQGCSVDLDGLGPSPMPAALALVHSLLVGSTVRFGISYQPDSRTRLCIQDSAGLVAQLERAFEPHSRQVPAPIGLSLRDCFYRWSWVLPSICLMRWLAGLCCFLSAEVKERHSAHANAVSIKTFWAALPENFEQARIEFPTRTPCLFLCSSHDFLLL